MTSIRPAPRLRVLPSAEKVEEAVRLVLDDGMATVVDRIFRASGEQSNPEKATAEFAREIFQEWGDEQLDEFIATTRRLRAEKALGIR